MRSRLLLTTEQQRIMGAAAEAMKAYHDQHGEYAREWRLLDFDRFDRPKQVNKEFWQPSRCQYVYQIVLADQNHFLIQALGWEDKPVYEIRDGMRKPTALPGAEVKLAKFNPDVPEPKLFLPVAAAAMKAYQDKNQEYSTHWRSLKITYSAIPYHTYDLNIRPDENNNETWRPRGCDYYYRIVPTQSDHFLIQAIGRTDTVEYEIRDGMTEARFLQEPAPLASVRR